MKVLALDQSAFTGFCFGEPGHMPICGTHRLPASFTGSKRARSLYKWVREMIEANGIGRVYFEEPIIPKATGFKTVYGLMGLATAIGFAADEVGIPCFAIRQQTWRSEFGVPTQAPRRIKEKDERRRWLKAQTVSKCEALGLEVPDDNAADAAGLWICVTRRLLAKEQAPQFDFTETIKLG